MTLAKRIIPCLDVKDGRVVKGVRFDGLMGMGEPALLARKYCAQGADELCFLDICATAENRATMLSWVTAVAEEVDMPFCVGGGVKTLFDFTALMRSGADKVCTNSAALARPGLIFECAREYGSQAVVVAIDYRMVDGTPAVFSDGGAKAAQRGLFEWAAEAVALGAGELLVTSIDADGTKAGFGIPTLKQLSSAVGVPVIASGGAGCAKDFLDVFTQTRCTGALAAGVFHRDELGIGDVKKFLKESGVEVRC